MAWLESHSRTFSARHEAADSDDAEQVLVQLESARLRLLDVLGDHADAPGLALVLHGTEAQLDAAQPWVVLQRRRMAPAARRYLVGWATGTELHVLSPRALAHRASNAPGSLEFLMLTPVALLARCMIAAANPALPPPLTIRTFRRYLRWAWLIEGGAQWLSGQTPHARPAVVRRLREDGPPEFPPGVRDAFLLGGTVFDLLAREEGPRAAAELAVTALEGGPSRALTDAFHGRAPRHTEAAWRGLLERLAGR